MPKMKTHSGAKKRFRLTGSGKIMYKKANRGHLMVQKNSKRARRLEQPAELAPANAKIVKRLLGI